MKKAYTKNRISFSILSGWQDDNLTTLSLYSLTSVVFQFKR